MSKFREYTKNWLKKETKAERQIRALKILNQLKKTYPKAHMALNYNNNFQLLVAVVLSAQCTDKKVNEVTTSLFKKYKTVHEFARADLQTFEKVLLLTLTHN